MIDLKQLQQKYSSHRKEMLEADLKKQKAQVDLNKLEASENNTLKGLDQRTREQQQQEFAQQKEALAASLKEAGDNNKGLKKTYWDEVKVYLDQLDPQNEIAELNDAFPILLFPLRLEIRFKSTGAQKELWIRVYPDDCNINSKEDLLSESELLNAKTFWRNIWMARQIETEEKAAWKSLVNSHGSGRAAWIIQHYKPGNVIPPKRDASYKILLTESGLALTNNEWRFSADYWASVFLAKGNIAAIDTAFNTLVGNTSNALALEIREKTLPVNLTDEVAASLTKDKIVLERIELPVYAAKLSGWTKSATTMLLPNKFVAILNGSSSSRTVIFSKPVKEPLATSPDPSLEKKDQISKNAENELVLNEDLQWMVDFDKAEAVGMATKIPLINAESTDGFQKLTVLGIRFSSDTEDSKEQLEKLISDHFYSKNGFGLIRQGTPTNNTEDHPSGVSWTDNPDESFVRIFRNSEEFDAADDLDKKSDGEKLADSLGVDPDIFKWVPNANGKDQLEANAMNTALFPATLGYFMEEMMDPLFDERNINATRAFMSNFVSGRGPVPAIRIGKQPYGILPVSAYSRLQFEDDITAGLRAVDTNKQSFLTRLHELIMKMDQAWDDKVDETSFIGQQGDPHQVLLDIIGLHPTSVEYHQRYSQSLKQLYNQLLLQSDPVFAKSVIKMFADRAKEVLRDIGVKNNELKLPILQKYFLSEPNLLSGVVIDDVPDSESNPIRAYCTRNNVQLNYIKWLAETDIDKIRIENFEGLPAPTALLYLLLRHALMQVQADAGAKLLIKNKLAIDKKEFHDPDFIGVEKNTTGKSKFEHLYTKYPTVTGNDELTLGEYIYQDGQLSGETELGRLNEVISALKILENTPTARLERLLAEHLDCCSYRIDAWKTGLVQYKLLEQRNTGTNGNGYSKGLYIGAYGILLDVKPSGKTLTPVNLNNELSEIFDKGGAERVQSDSENLGYIHAPSLNQASAAAILRNAFQSNKGSGTGNPFSINMRSDRVRIAVSLLEGMRNGQPLSALLGYHFERGLHDKHSLGQGEADVFIAPLRKAFPLVADNLVDTKSNPGDSIESIEANNVIDGLKLILYVSNSSVKTYPFGLPSNIGLPPILPANQKSVDAVNEEVLKLIDINDAISDLVISEQVYQVVQGNFERAAANADAFSKGNYPPEITVVDTPRSGVTITQRMCIMMDANVVADPNHTPRAIAEPMVNKWLASILPLPEKVFCKISYKTLIADEPDIKLSLKDLGLQPIDLLYILDMDTEQAMTSLDDKITNYVRYTLAKHPNSEITINYTEIIDKNDRTKISFFELAALIKSLRALLTGNRFLSASQLTPLQEGANQASVMDDTDLRLRLTDSVNSLSAVKNAIDAIITNAVSINSITEDFKNKLIAKITDKSILESVLIKIKDDCNNYLTNTTNARKAELASAFETSIAVVGNAADIANLKLNYEKALTDYTNDFKKLDVLFEELSAVFMKAAFFNPDQTGSGFMLQGVNRAYETILEKLEKIIERWERYDIDFTAIMASYDPLGDSEVQYLLLQKAERLIAAVTTFPLPGLFTDFKTNILDVKKAAFDTALTNLRQLRTNNKKKVIEFLEDTEAAILPVTKHDILSFDMDLERNDTSSEKLQLAILKEDALLSARNLANAIAKKIDAANLFVTNADATMINADKISVLIEAVKKIFSDDIVFLPKFSLSGTLANEMENCYLSGNTGTLLNFSKNKEGRSFPVEDWLGGVARVRKAIHEFENAGFLSRAFSPAAGWRLTPLQFPYKDDDRWLALKFRDETDSNEKDENGNYKFTVNNDKLLFTGLFTVPFAKADKQCGVIMDEWTELIPADQETTGITFHYDQPNSEPPQTILLAVPPKLTGNWKWIDLVDAIDETIEMAKKRAVEPLHIEQTPYAQFLPTTMLAVTMQWITVATNLSVNNNIYNTINAKN